MSHRDLVISDDVFNHHWLADSMLGFPLLNYGTGAQYGVSIALLVCSGGSDISIGAPVRRNHNRCSYSFSLMYGAYNVSSTSNPTSGGSMALGRSPCCQLTWTVVSSLKHASGANGNLEHTGRCDSARAGWIYYSREWYSHDFVQKQDGSMNPWVHDHRNAPTASKKQTSVLSLVFRCITRSFCTPSNPACLPITDACCVTCTPWRATWKHADGLQRTFPRQPFEGRPRRTTSLVLKAVSPTTVARTITITALVTASLLPNSSSYVIVQYFITSGLQRISTPVLYCTCTSIYSMGIIKVQVHVSTNAIIEGPVELL